MDPSRLVRKTSLPVRCLDWGQGWLRSGRWRGECPGQPQMDNRPAVRFVRTSLLLLRVRPSALVFLFCPTLGPTKSRKPEINLL
ncbi:hypothetical protein PoB_001457100 [Plakobranchus ocellatus]|uniref:Uncharacterized protein n=1 Tax=Plakobranchus ocellatus TaxID=259542 RepID=A0AAV3YX39_9GAST|nr:hypothetical protein PoB_001457100 [Plakobranchus ocellatus]